MRIYIYICRMIKVLEKDQNCNDLLAETLIDLMITFFSNIGDIDDRLYFKILNHFIHFTKSKKFTREVAVAPNSLLTGSPEPVFRD